MKAVIIKRADKNYIRGKQKELRERYGSLDSLGQKASIEKCSFPELIDDYELWKALKKGGDMKEEVIFHDSSIFQILSPSRAEILDFMSRNTVGSIKELAHAVKRDYKNVYFDIAALKKQELVEMRKKGRENIPVSRIEKIEILFD